MEAYTNDPRTEYPGSNCQTEVVPNRSHLYKATDRMAYETARQHLLRQGFKSARIYNAPLDITSFQRNLREEGYITMIDKQEGIPPDTLKLTQEQYSLLTYKVVYYNNDGNFVQTFIKERQQGRANDQQPRLQIQLDPTEGKWLDIIGYIGRTHHRLHHYSTQQISDTLYAELWKLLPDRLRRQYKEARKVLHISTRKLQPTLEEYDPHTVGEKRTGDTYRLFMIKTTEEAIKIHFKNLEPQQWPKYELDGHGEVALQVFQRSQMSRVYATLDRAYNKYIHLRNQDENGRKVVFFNIAEAVTPQQLINAVIPHVDNPIESAFINRTRQTKQPIGFALLGTKQDATYLVAAKTEICKELPAFPEQTVGIAISRDEISGTTVPGHTDNTSYDGKEIVEAMDLNQTRDQNPVSQDVVPTQETALAVTQGYTEQEIQYLIDQSLKKARTLWLEEAANAIQAQITQVVGEEVMKQVQVVTENMERRMQEIIRNNRVEAETRRRENQQLHAILQQHTELLNQIAAAEALKPKKRQTRVSLYTARTKAKTVDSQTTNADPRRQSTEGDTAEEADMES